MKGDDKKNNALDGLVFALFGVAVLLMFTAPGETNPIHLIFVGGLFGLYGVVCSSAINKRKRRKNNDTTKTES